MSGFSCCFWWFLLGALLGWLLNWLLSKWTRKDDSSRTGSGRRRHRTSSNGVDRISSDHPGTSNTNSDSATSAADTVGAVAAHSKSRGADNILAALEGFKIRGNNDFEIIKGIGPKIAGLFKESGTHTFAQLAALSLADMHKVLENGGSQFKVVNPGTWALQSRLCDENRWIELRTLQDALDGGIASSDSHNA